MLRRFFVPDLSHAGPLELPPEEARHAAQVLRVAPGDRVELFNGRGEAAAADVESVGKRRVRVVAGPVEEIGREAPRPVALAVSLPKGDRQRFVVEKAVELGAAHLVPLRCERSVVQPRGGTLERLRRTVVEASKQCGRNQLMEVTEPAELSALDRRYPECPDRWIAHPMAQAVRPQPANASTPLLIAVGPEGGFTDAEVAAALHRGWTAVSLGPRILRIETAATALLAIAQWGAERP